MDQPVGGIRLDLALEAREVASHSMGETIPGVEIESGKQNGITTTRIRILNEEGAQALGKLPGSYITLEVPGLRHKDSDLQNQVSRHFAKEFASLLERLSFGPHTKVLLIGLGNAKVTPDSLGPLVVDNVMVTRHLFELMPEQVGEGYRSVSAVAPGVLGTTGIETSEIVQGIVEKSKPDLLIAVDALASKALERVNTTIQISDTGIHPGSGIGNKRMGLTEELLGIPVIAVGVPTVVYASTIVTSSMQLVIQHFKKMTDHTDLLFGELDKMNENERLEMVKEVLNPMGHDLLVTPKEIDEFIEDIANVIATGLNGALHKDVNPDNVAAFTH